MSIKQVLITAIGLLVSLWGIFSHAQVHVGTITSYGSACPAGTFSVTFSPNYSYFSVLFDSFVVESNGTPGSRHVRQSCGLNIPIQMDPGFRMVVKQVDIRGFADLSAGAKLQVASQLVIAKNNGGNGVPNAFKQDFTGPQSDSLFVSTKIRHGEQSSRCGGANVIKITNLMTLNNGSATSAFATIDSADGAGDVIYYTTIEPCS